MASISLCTGVAQAAEQRSQAFSYTGGSQQFVVPAGVTSVQVALVGGHGGTGALRVGSEAQGGEGESILARLSVSPGELLFVEVGGDGESGNTPGSGRGGYGGGGSAESSEGLEQSGGGGGGASDVRTVEGSLASRLVVAAGGGGGGGEGLNTAQSTMAFPGGRGGEAGIRGLNGTAVPGHALGGEGGSAGTAVSGGAAGATSSVSAAIKGSEGSGGNGGGSGLNVGGGGGGGIFGGGGGGGGEGVGSGGNFYSGGSGGGGGGSSGLPAGSSATLLREEVTSAAPSVTFTWTAPPPAATTGTAQSIASTSATVTGSVNPNDSLVSECQFSISPAPPAGASVPCAQQVGAGGSPVGVSAALSGLSPTTQYTVTLSASSAQGSASGAPVQFTTPQATATATTSTATSGAVGPALSLTGLRLSPTRFRRGRLPAKVTVTRLPTKTTISFASSKGASATLTFQRAQPGSLVGRTCRAISKTHRAGRPCTRYTPVGGDVALQARAGTNTIAFDGVLSGGRSLAPGSYRISLSAVADTSRAGAAQHPVFTLLA